MAPRILTEALTGEGRAVIVPDMDGPALRGGGTVTFTCPGCHSVLAEQVAADRIWDLVIECNRCQTFGEFPRLPAGAFAENYVFFPAGRYRITQPLETKGTLLIGVGAIQAGGTPYVH